MFSTNFADWNVEKGQQGKNVLSIRLSRRVYCSFLSDNVLFTPKMKKVIKLSNCRRFHAFFPNFRRTWSFGTLKRVNKERLSCPVYLDKDKDSFSMKDVRNRH